MYIRSWPYLTAMAVVLMFSSCSAVESTASGAGSTSTTEADTASTTSAVTNPPDPGQSETLIVDVEGNANPAGDDTDAGPGDDKMSVEPNEYFGRSLELPVSAGELAEALSDVEQVLRADDPALTAQDLAGLGRYQQSLYRTLSFHPEWVDPVLAAVDEDVAAAVALNWEARENLRDLLATHTIHDTMPAWRIVEPFPAAELLSYYKEAEERTGIDWEYVAAINLVETRMGRIQGISTAGAVGPMQFLPTTWAECCEGDPTDPRDAIIGAATYLTHRGGPDNMSKAIWGYNNSDYYVNAVTAYADVLRLNERAYFGYHGWGIYFLTTSGVIFIEEGYEQAEEIPVTEWLGNNPDTLVTG